MLESLNYSFRNPKNIIWVIYRIKQLRNYKKTMGSSEDPSLVNYVDELGLAYYGLINGTIFQKEVIERKVYDLIFSTNDFWSIIIIIIIIIIVIQSLGWFGQRPELSQATGMDLVRCILGKFLGVVCHCFSPAFRRSHFRHQLPPRPPQRERS